MNDEGAAPGRPLLMRRRGREAAIELGHQLVSGDLKAARIAGWADFASKHPDGYLYSASAADCARRIGAAVAARRGEASTIRATGGYKAMRSFLMEAIAEAVATRDFCVLGGLTGTGETDVIVDVAAAVGPGRPGPPPRLRIRAPRAGAAAADRLRECPGHRPAASHGCCGYRALVVEDEGRFHRWPRPADGAVATHAGQPRW
ncbi:hypothetical protein ACTMU2_36275 [Cupriavidus basilensis]